MNKKLVVTVVTSVFLIVAVFLTVYLLQQRQEPRREAAGGPASLSLLPASGEYNPEESFDVNIFLDDGGRDIAGADVSLTFDSAKLSVELVTPGSLFDNPNTENNEQIVLKNDVIGNKILLSLGSLDPQTGASYFASSGVYGTIRFSALEIGSALVTTDGTPDSKVAEVGGEDILGETSGGIYTVALAPTPTPTPPPGSVPCNRTCLSAGYHCVRGLECIQLTDLVGSDKCRNPDCPEEEDCVCPTPTPTPTPAPIAGDLNDDGEVNILDFSIFVNYYREGNLEGDFNEDGGVDILDFSLFVSYYQQAQ